MATTKKVINFFLEKSAPSQLVCPPNVKSWLCQSHPKQPNLARDG